MDNIKRFWIYLVSLICLIITGYIVFSIIKNLSICTITALGKLEPTPNYTVGDMIHIEGKSTCGTVRFEIDDRPRPEIGSSNLTMDINSTELGVGDHKVCFVLRGREGWDTAERLCKLIIVNCAITSFTYSPSSLDFSYGNGVVSFNGKSSCKKVKYTLNGRDVLISDSTNLMSRIYSSFNGGEVCFLGSVGDNWENADYQCVKFNVELPGGKPPVRCESGNHVTFVADLSIPDGTKLLPGEKFIKTWRVLNDGKCLWDGFYSFGFIQGDRMEGKDQSFQNETFTGEAIDLSVTMQAPLKPGKYKSYWGIMDGQGNLVNSKIYVSIEVLDGSDPSLSENDAPVISHLDLLSYCDSLDFPGAFITKDNIWMCASSTKQVKVDFDEACKLAYGDLYSKAVVNDIEDPQSWYCVQKDKPESEVQTVHNQ